MNFFRTTFAWFRASIRGFDTPGQLALGFSLGMVLGLLPKDSLLFYGFGLLSILSTGNLLSLICGGVLFHGLSLMLDPLTHDIGLAILTATSLESVWLQISELPFIAWTRFNNTIVMGSLGLGLALFLPVYLISFLLFRKFGKQVNAWFNGSNLSLGHGKLLYPNGNISE